MSTGASLPLLFALILLSACAYQLGRAPLQAAAVGEVVALSADPQVERLLSSALERSLAEAGALAVGPELDLQLSALRTRPVAEGAAILELSAEVRAVLHVEPLRVESWTERTEYVLISEDPLATEAARVAALRGLTERAAEEAVQRLLRAGG